MVFLRKTLPNMKIFGKILPIVLFSLALNASVGAQEKPYFVDGFHGGVYGHYPLKTYTGYMTGLLEKHPEWKMCLEIEPETWDSVRVAAPEDYRIFRDQVIKSGRVEYTNPTYGQPYCYNITGESLIRQFDYGIRKLREHFPDICFNTYAVEEPCFTSSLPAILKGFGFKYASTKCPNTCWGGYAAATGGELINWIGPDGTSILTSPRHEVESLGNDVWTTIANANSSEYVKACRDAGFKHVIGMCYQDAGWEHGPWLSSAVVSGAEDSEYVTWTEYFEEIAKDVEPEDYKYSQENVRGALMWGTQVMQRIGRSVRGSELSVTGAEKMGVMANLANRHVYDADELDEAWRGLLLAQHHDSWIVPYNGLKRQGTWADWITDKWCVNADRLAAEAQAEAVQSFAKDMKRSDPLLLRVYNTMGINRIEPVSVDLPKEYMGASVQLKDSKGAVVPSWTGLSDGKMTLIFKAEVPSFGYETYSLMKVEAKPEAMMPEATKVLENSMYRIEFDPKRGGVIKSLVCKTGGKREIVSKGEYLFGEIKGHFADLGRFCSSADAPATVMLVEDNDFVKTVRISGFIASHPFTETITILEGDPKIHFDLDIDWKGDVAIGEYRQQDAYKNPERAIYDEKYRMNIYFPAALKSPELYKQAPFDVCKSELESTRFSNWNDIKHNIILGWVDLEDAEGNGFSLFSDHTTAYAYGDTPLALAVQASGNGLWGRHYVIDRPTELSFCIMPHRTGDWEEPALEYNRWTEPLVCTFQKSVPVRAASYLDLSSARYSISGSYLTDEGIVLRLYNETQDGSARKVRVSSCIESVSEIDLQGNVLRTMPLEASADMKCFEAKMPSLGFRTYLLKRGKSPADYVNPMIGASTSVGAAGVYHGLGKTFPGATWPFGMVQASPQTITGGDNGPGYSDEHRTIEGFSMVQMSGIGWFGEFGNFLIMPTVGEKMHTIAGREDGTLKGWRSEYDKDSECAKAGYYSVYLNDYKVKAEMTASHHCGFFRFTYPESENSRIQIDLARRVGGTAERQAIRVVDEKTIAGWMKCTPDCGGWGDGEGSSDYTVYFYATFDKPMTDYGFWSADIPDSWSRHKDDVVSDGYLSRVAESQIIRGVNELEGKHIGFFTDFATKEGEEVNMKVGISFVDVEGAYRNYRAEAENMDFDRARARAWNRWESELDCIDIKGGTEDERTVFYTSLYHTMIDPRIYEDVDGRYVGGDHKVHRNDGTFRKRTIFSGWDVFRSQMPLQTIINPEMVEDLINSLVTMADQSGREYFERWEIVNAYSGCMLGNPATSVLADAYMKGLRNYDVEKAYRYAKNSSAKFGNDRLGFTPGGLSISHTLEYAYTDWCISELARALGKEDEAKEFAAKGQAYRNLFDAEHGWFRPREEDGSWTPWKEGAKILEWYGCIEATPYQQGWFVPHDVDGLVGLLGGKENALRELEEFFDKAPADFSWNAYYNHANEPVHLVPFLFNRLDAPWLTQKWTRIICRDAYKNQVEGIVGNEDVGQMSAWYILAAAGIHQACPGDTSFEVTSPVFDEITFNLDTRYAKAEQFKVIAHDNGPENLYIRKAVLNGKELDRLSIDYSDIVSGSVLELWMTDKPSK